MSNVVDTVDLVEAGAARERNEIFTGCPAVVTALQGKGYVDVRPMIRKPVLSEAGDPVFEERPTIPHVRYVWLQSGGFYLKCPIMVGTSGYLLGFDHDFATWLRLGTLSDPADLRHAHLANSIFIPGLCFEGDTPDTIDDPDFVIQAPPSAKIRLVASADAKAARDDKVEANLDAIKTALDAIASAAGTTHDYVKTPVGAEQVWIK